MSSCSFLGCLRVVGGAFGAVVVAVFVAVVVAFVVAVVVAFVVAVVLVPCRGCRCCGVVSIGVGGGGSGSAVSWLAALDRWVISLFRRSSAVTARDNCESTAT